MFVFLGKEWGKFSNKKVILYLPKLTISSASKKGYSSSWQTALQLVFNVLSVTQSKRCSHSREVQLHRHVKGRVNQQLDVNVLLVTSSQKCSYWRVHLRRNVKGGLNQQLDISVLLVT